MKHSYQKVFICFLALSYLGIAQIFPTILIAEQLEWKIFGELQETRHRFNAVAISSYQVLVMGGFAKKTTIRGTEGVATSLCEIIDIRQRRVLQAASTNVAHGEGVVLQTPDSNIVVLSGLDTTKSETPICEMYNRRTGTWRVLGSLLIGRWQHAATFINSEEILVVGGRIGAVSLAEAEIFNIRTGQSSMVADFPYKNSQGVAFLSSVAAPGKPLVIGGRTGGLGSYQTSCIYEFERQTNQWKRHSWYPGAITINHEVRLPDKRMFIVGGGKNRSVNSCLGIENAQGFASHGNLLEARSWAETALWNNEIVFIAGGITLNGGQPSVLSETEWFDISTGYSIKGPALHFERAYFRMASLHESGKQGEPQKITLLAIAGVDEQFKSLASIEILETTSTVLIAMPHEEIALYRIQQLLTSPLAIAGLMILALVLIFALLYILWQIILVKKNISH